MLCILLAVVAALLLFASATQVHGRMHPMKDMVIDDQALLMKRSAEFGRAINGVAFQTQPVMTFGDFQFAAWYHINHATKKGTIYLGRRKHSSSSSTWESFDTTITLINGGKPWWDAHHVVSMGISAEGKIHLAYDIHGNTLRYATSTAGAATNTRTIWNATIMQPERSSLNEGEALLSRVSYARFLMPIDGKKQLLMSFRQGGSGKGDIFITIYNSKLGQWARPWKIIDGQVGNYSDKMGSSTERNAYMNGISRGHDGTLHITWTWRESAKGANHDIMYAFSKDDGRTWRNNEGKVIGNSWAPIHLNSHGAAIAKIDRQQSLMNQQSQAVDREGGVHLLLWHRRFDEARYKWQEGDTPFSTTFAAYYHYYRDPSSRTWTRRRLPTSENVGSRPQIAIDANDNLLAVFTSPDVIPANKSIYADGKLVIAGARRLSKGYDDWEILYKDDRRVYSGEPLVDRVRLHKKGILSVFLQESSTTLGLTSSPLHVIEFSVLAKPLAVEPPKPAIPMFLMLVVVLVVITLRKSRKVRKKK